MFVKWTPNETSSSKEGLWPSVVGNGALQCHFGSLYSKYPYPLSYKKNLFRFTLISRMVMGVEKSLKSDLSLKILIPEVPEVHEWQCNFRLLPNCQSTQNHFGFAGHGSLSRHFKIISSSDILFNLLSKDILSGENSPLRWTFENFAGHVRQDRRILRTLKLHSLYRPRLYSLPEIRPRSITAQGLKKKQNILIPVSQLPPTRCRDACSLWPKGGLPCHRFALVGVLWTHIDPQCCPRERRENLTVYKSWTTSFLDANPLCMTFFWLLFSMQIHSASKTCKR